MAEEKKWPIYFKDNLIHGNPESEIGIATLWTPAKDIAVKINPSLFYVMGQLYSKEGIDFILRNILTNPKIRYIIVCGRELSGSGKTLIDFFENGVDENHKIIGSDNTQIDENISLGALETVRKEVKVENMIGISDAEQILEKIKAYKPIGGLFSESQIFPESKKESQDALPSEESVFTIRGKYIGQVWLDIIKTIWRFGSVRSSFYGNFVREAFNIAAVVSEEDSFNPKMFSYMQVSEEEIEKYCKYIMDGNRGDEVYSYGERLWNYKGINQVEEVMIPFLKKYPTDRAAIAIMFDLANDHKAERSPCMCLVQAATLNGKLNLTAYFRSHAVFSGWVLNAFGLRRLQKYVADNTRYEMGILTIFSNCAHIYDNEWKTVEEIVKKHGNNYECVLDPRGYFVISVEGKEIIAKHYSPDGKFLKEYKQDGMAPKSAMAMYNQLLNDNAVSQVAHAFDIGAELQKAEIAIKKGLKYMQDKAVNIISV